MKTSIQNRANEAASQPAVSISGQQAPPGVANGRQPAVQSQLDSASRLGHRFDAVDTQPTLSLGPVDDHYEQQAHQVADQVIAHVGNQSNASVMLSAQPAPVAGLLQRDVASAAGASNTDPVSSDIAASIDSVRGGGRPLPTQIRQPMEQAFGTRFNQVRLHSDVRAQSLSRRLSARAFTVGSDIFLRDGAHEHDAPEKLRLLAHELTHTIQQTQSGLTPRAAGARIQRNHEYTDTERERIKELPSNTANKVYKVRYNRKLGKTNTKTGYFKPLSDPDAGGEGDPYTLDSVARSRALYKLSEKLGLKILAKEKVATHTIGEGANQRVVKGSLSADVTGAQPLRRDGRPTNADLSKPETQKGLSDLQLFDALTGQRDRHAGNIYVHPVTGKVTGIDEDLSLSAGVKPMVRTEQRLRQYGEGAFRKGMQDPDTAAEGELKYLGLPSLVDKSTAKKFLELTPQKLQAHLTLNNEHPLSAEDMQKAQDRLGMVQEHLTRLRTDNQLVTRWDDTTYGRARDEPDFTDARNPLPRSYLKRTLGERDLHAREEQEQEQERIREHGNLMWGEEEQPGEEEDLVDL